MQLYIGGAIVLLQLVVMFFQFSQIKKYSNRVDSLATRAKQVDLDLEAVNKNLAIIERVITPFMEWVDMVQQQQQAMVKDAAEKAEAFQKAPLAKKKPKEKE